jgi:hypothetical protein
MWFMQSMDLDDLFKASDANQDAVLTINEFPIVPTKEAKIKVIKGLCNGRRSIHLLVSKSSLTHTIPLARWENVFNLTKHLNEP